MIFWGCIENWQGNYLLMFFPTDAGDFTCLAGFFSLMWEILHACRETGRNGVQAGDSLSMRESWKPCLRFILVIRLNEVLLMFGQLFLRGVVFGSSCRAGTS